MASLRERKRELKSNLLKNRRVVGPNGRMYACELMAYEPHQCKGGTHMNEVLFKKNDFTKLPTSEKHYFYHPINCHVCCGYSHAEWGHSRGWRRMFYDMQVRRFGQEAVDEYIANAPLDVGWV